MKWLTFEIQRTPGFRFNLLDLGMIALLVLLAVFLWQVSANLMFAALPLYVGVTFFLFCNVFRIGNRLEPWWYVPFAITAAYCLYRMEPGLLWWLILVIFEPLKWVLIAYRIVRGPYHGAWSRARVRAQSDAGE